MCTVEGIYIKDNELCFDLIKKSWGEKGAYGIAEKLKGVTWDFILDKTLEMDIEESSLRDLVKYICKKIHELVIPSSVTSISAEFFKGCTSLQKIVISEGVTEIGESAFSGCRTLREIVIPSTVTKIRELAFNKCHSLEKVTIPEGVAEICKNAFRCCNNLHEVVISSSVTSIGPFAFSGCSSLEIVHLPAAVASIEINSFKDCNNLNAIYVPENNVDYYKERLPADIHRLIVEEGSALPIKADIFIAKDVSFAPKLRVIVPKGESDSYAQLAAKKILEGWKKEAIIEWAIGLLGSITDSAEPYDAEKDKI